MAKIPTKKTAPLRFAHPFYTKTPPDKRAAHPGGYGTRMEDHIKSTLGAIPKPKRNTRLTLDEIIGADSAKAIADSGEIFIHLAGDTGVTDKIDRETKQVIVADAMAKDFDVSHPEKCPAFFCHLGDVIYGPEKDAYLSQFYKPYIHYPGKIVAIPGNHDGESDFKLTEFQQYFCASKATVPPIAGSIFRQTMTQPGVYWLLDAPYLQIVGLYSNNAENPGFISGEIPGQHQKNWLIKTLKEIVAERKNNPRKGLLFATHHPPFSSGGHSGSKEMLADIDDACTQAGIMPDAFFSGHAHSIQRYTRSIKFNGKQIEIPYIITGCGGHGGQTVDATFPKTQGDHIYEFGYKGWGYTTVKASANTLKIVSFGVDEKSKKKIDSISVDLKTNRISK